MKHKRYPGFTIVEILVVIIIIAMLASMVAFFYIKQQAESRDQKRDADIHALAHELDAYYEKTGNYPLACDYSADIDTSCSAMQSAYVLAFPTATPKLIGKTSTTNDIRQILPSITDGFGDPRSGSGHSINQHSSSGSFPIMPNSYFMMSLDSLNQSTTIRLATTTSGGGIITCTYNPSSTTSNRGENRGVQPFPYVLGYFSELDNKWVLYQGPHKDTTNKLNWNSGNTPECATSDL